MPLNFKTLLLGLILALIPTLLLHATAGKTLRPAIQRGLSSFQNATFFQRKKTIPGTIRSITKMAVPKKTPVYFLSHGGPNIMEETQHPAYAKLEEIGHEITRQVRPEAVVVISGHWEGYKDVIEVNTAETMPLIYDFYGFPPHYYEFEYPHTGSPELAEKVLGMLKGAGIKAEGVRRGLDHGVWASFMCLFSPERNPLNVPIVQVSLFGDEDPDMHYNLGKALSPLREEGVQIIVSGMAVHNLRDMMKAYGKPGALDYTYSFDEALREAVEQPVGERQRAMAELLKRKDARKAHPSFDREYYSRGCFLGLGLS